MQINQLINKRLAFHFRGYAISELSFRLNQSLKMTTSWDREAAALVLPFHCKYNPYRWFSVASQIVSIFSFVGLDY